MNLLDFYFPEWAFVALNLLIMVLVLKRFLWKPVNKILEARQAMAAKAQEDSEAAGRFRAEIDQLREQAEAQVRAEAAQRLTEARSKAGKEYDRIVSEAEAKAEMVISAAKTKAEQERERILRDAQRQVAATALEAAGILLRENMDSERNRHLVEVFLAEKEVSA
jgi:F-type H+-transporting ATPase subunit b